MQPGNIEEPDDNLHPRYVRVRHVGMGAHGSVWLGYRRANPAQEVALKYVTVRLDYRMNIMREISNHFKLHHPHIVSLHNVTLYGDNLVLEMEAMHGGDMQQFMQRFPRGMPEHVARWYFQQIVLAVDYCHKKYVCNRDIKLENILLTQPPNTDNLHPVVKLCDFGWSKDEVGDSAPHTCAGTPSYIAPEILLGQGQYRYEGDTADAWSLGVLLYCLVVGRFPFQVRPDKYVCTSFAELKEMTKRITTGEFTFPEGNNLSEGVKDLIKALLTVNPAARLKVGNVLNHSWCFEGCSNELREKTQQFNLQVLACQEEQRCQERVAQQLACADRVFQLLGWEAFNERAMQMNGSPPVL